MAVVREVGVAVKHLHPGDHVIPALAGIGKYIRTYVGNYA